VVLPSHREAYMDNSKPITVVQTSTESFNVTNESFVPAIGNTFTDSLTQIEESAIPQALEYVKTESKRVKELASFFNSNFENVKLVDESTVLITDGEQKLFINLEDYIRNDISSCFTKINNLIL
jgi:hypothetical protein